MLFFPLILTKVFFPDQFLTCGVQKTGFCDNTCTKLDAQPKN